MAKIGMGLAAPFFLGAFYVKPFLIYDKQIEKLVNEKGFIFGNMQY